MARITIASRLAEAALQPPGPGNYRCEQCKRFQGCSTSPFLRGTATNSKKVKVVFVSEYPTLEECIKRRQFLSPVARLFKEEVILKVGLMPEDVGFVSAVACYGAAPTAEQLRMCGAFAKASIEAFHPQKVVLLGAEATQAIMQIKSPVLKDMTSTVYDLCIQPDPVAMIVTYNMRMMLRDLNYVEVLRKHIGTFVNGKMQQKIFPELVQI